MFHRWLPALFSCLVLPALVASAQTQFTGVVEEEDSEAGTLAIEVQRGGDFPDGARIVGRAGSGDLAVFESGDLIKGRAVKSGKVTYLENLWPADPVHSRIMQGMNQRLRRDTVARGQKVFRTVGERVPHFALWDQKGNLFQADQFRGKATVVNFIFTRCTNPIMCPASTQKMARLQDAVREAGIEDVQFVSITLDPAYDTPGIFHAYAGNYGIEHDNFFFLGGDNQAVEDLKMQLGILAEDHPTFIVNHTMRTIIVGPDATITYQVPGSGWDVDDFLNRLKNSSR